MSADVVDEKVAAATQALPVFFNRIDVLDPAKHGDLKLNRGSGFRFAAGTNSVSLCLQEIISAADFYPVVFTEAALTPLAVVGCRDGENAFIDSNGRWRPGVYIPAYLRAWPFIPVNTDDPEKLLMGIEPDSDHLRHDTGLPLFDGSNPTPVLKEIAALSMSYRGNVTETREFVQALEMAGVLHNRGAGLKFRNGDTIQLRGFKALDPAKLDEVPDATFLEWRRRKWLPAIYAILRATTRWAPLIELTELRRAPDAPTDSIGDGLLGSDSVPNVQ